MVEPHKSFSQMLGATATPSSQAPVFDAAKLDELKAVLDRTKFVGLVGQFAVSLNDRIQRLQLLLDGADWPGAAREAHDIVSVAGNIGAARLSALARDVEQSCKAEDGAGCRSLSSKLAADAAAAISAIKDYQAAA